MSPQFRRLLNKTIVKTCFDFCCRIIIFADQYHVIGISQISSTENSIFNHWYLKWSCLKTRRFADFVKNYTSRVDTHFLAFFDKSDTYIVLLKSIPTKHFRNGLSTINYVLAELALTWLDLSQKFSSRKFKIRCLSCIPIKISFDLSIIILDILTLLESSQTCNFWLGFHVGTVFWFIRNPSNNMWHFFALNWLPRLTCFDDLYFFNLWALNCELERKCRKKPDFEQNFLLPKALKLQFKKANLPPRVSLNMWMALLGQLHQLFYLKRLWNRNTATFL